jgi:hypothetical protein
MTKLRVMEPGFHPGVNPLDSWFAAEPRETDSIIDFRSGEVIVGDK